MSREVWRHVTFAEAVDINPKRSLQAGTVVPYVEMAAVPAEGATIGYLLERQAGGGGAKFQNGDTLFARITPCAENGKAAFVDCLPVGAHGLGSTELIVFGPKPELTHPEYVYHLATSELVRGPAISQMVGTTGRARVPNTVFDEITIPLPPIHEQRRIAEILSSVDAAIAATRAVIEQTRKVRSEVLSTSFPENQAAGPSTADDTFEGWSVEPASSICESIIDCKNRTPPVTEDGYAVVRTPNVRNGRFRYEGLQFTDRQGFQEWTAKGMPRAGDILFTREAPYGEVCMAPAMAFCLGQRMMFLRPDTSRVSSDFLLYALQSGPVKKEMFRRAGGSTVGHLRVGDVRELPIPVAPRDVQVRLTSTLRSLDEALYGNEESLSRLEDCKSALMSDLLTGRKRVIDALLMAAE